MALPLFAITLFVSAFLLFLVQPMIGKMILPKLGGTPQVWNTCMVFFQTALVVGYGYSHTVSTRLSLRRQLFVHCAVLLLPLLVLLLWPYGPFNVADPVDAQGNPIVGADGKIERGWIPNPTAPPIPQTLVLLSLMVGLPYLVVATTSPLLQKWFASTGHPSAKDPYFLSIASNVGSMLALLAYPVIVEPSLGLRAQAWVWTGAYIGLGVLVVACVALVLKAPPSVQLAGASAPEGPNPEMPVPPPPAPETKPAPAPAAAAPPAETGIQPASSAPPQRGAIRRGSKQRGKAQRQQLSKASTGITSTPSVTHRHITPAAPTAPPRPYEMTTWRRLRWVMLAAIPSSLMLGIITYMCTDISAITYFWVIPLALYLLSFILVFMRWPIQWTAGPHTLMLILQPFCLICLIWILMTHQINPVYRSVAFCLLAFFATALVCHGEMARDRPPTRYLTEFYLWMSVGGMLGGMFNALLAPVLFTGLAELPLALVFAALLRPKMPGGGWTDTWIGNAWPEVANWFNQVGDDIYNQFTKQPEGTPDSATPTPAVVHHAPRGWFMGFSFDLMIGFLIVLIAAIFIWNGSGGWGWKNIYNIQIPEGVKLTDQKNGLFAFFHKTMGMQVGSAYWWTQTGSMALMFGLPLILALLVMARPLRFGLALGGILLVLLWQESSAEADKILNGGGQRSYFGILRVLETEDSTGRYHYLMHGTTHHGLNYMPEVMVPYFDVNGRPVPATKGKEKFEMRPVGRLATTYYHRLGPVGVVMEKLNWFNGQFGIAKKNDKGQMVNDKGEVVTDPALAKKEYYVNYKGTFNNYSADARLPASLVGTLIPDLMMPGGLPLSPVVTAWSDPPYATIGLGTGTMASYGRPYQHVVYYEIDEYIRHYNLKPSPYFTYVQDAIKRGVKMEIIMGDARLSMKEEREQTDTTYTRNPEEEDGILRSTSFPKRERYYRAIVVDAFSSDAIPVHLITREAIKMYMSKLIKHRPEKKNGPSDPGCHGGVLCVHTSNRHVNLVYPVTDVARDLGLKWSVGKDSTERARRGGGARDDVVDYLHIGHFGQEYVMLCENKADLPGEVDSGGQNINEKLHWSIPPNPGMRVWTDDYSNLMSVFRWGFDHRGE